MKTRRVQLESSFLVPILLLAIFTTSFDICSARTLTAIDRQGRYCHEPGGGPEQPQSCYEAAYKFCPVLIQEAVLSGRYLLSCDFAAKRPEFCESNYAKCVRALKCGGCFETGSQGDDYNNPDSPKHDLAVAIVEDYYNLYTGFEWPFNSPAPNPFCDKEFDVSWLNRSCPS